MIINPYFLIIHAGNCNDLMRKKNIQILSKRKSDHVKITVSEDVQFRNKTTGFELFDFEHNALPEISASEIDTSITFVKKQLKFPLMFSGMTGGYPKAETINRLLAIVCQDRGIAMGVGSQRLTLKSKTFDKSFSVVRKYAPSIPVVGNIGATEIENLKNTSPIQRMVDLIRADALAVHLNPLQEYLQPEGNTNFSGVLSGIENLAAKLSVPLIVKEIGAGISQSVAKKLFNAGVTIIDTAGAGGTSWSGIEIIRRKDPLLATVFWDWGIPTSDSIINVRKVSPRMYIIGSGGIRTGSDIAKALALGADMAATAAPVLSALYDGKEKNIHNLLDLWEKELRGVMFLTGVKSISDLKRLKLLKKKVYV